QRSLLGAIERLLRKKIPVQAIDLNDQKPVFALAGSPPSPVETPDQPRPRPAEEPDRPQREFRGRGEGRPYREKREGGYQGRQNGERRSNGEGRSYGNRDGRPA